MNGVQHGGGDAGQNRGLARRVAGVVNRVSGPPCAPPGRAFDDGALSTHAVKFAWSFRRDLFP